MCLVFFVPRTVNNSIHPLGERMKKCSRRRSHCRTIARGQVPKVPCRTSAKRAGTFVKAARVPKAACAAEAIQQAARRRANSRKSAAAAAARKRKSAGPSPSSAAKRPKPSGPDKRSKTWTSNRIKKKKRDDDYEYY